MKKLIALVLTLGGMVVLELPDPIPLIDEGIIMMGLVAIWGWAGVDLGRIFTRKSKSAERSQIIEVD